MVSPALSRHNEEMPVASHASLKLGSQVPDWAALTTEAHCPLCEYNLRGLAEPRCPECGYRFEWNELLDPARRLHAYLFEHHPERNIWSFTRTVLGGFRPGRFWRSLHPTQPSRPRRIRAYAVLTILPLLLLLLAHAAVRFSVELSVRQSYSRTFVNGMGVSIAVSPEMVIDSLRWGVASDNFVMLGIACVIWPSITWGSLMVFQWSMHRAHIRGVHVFRCVIYASDLLLAISVAYAAVVANDWLREFASSQWLPYNPGWLAAGVVLLLLLFTWRLIMAYRHYLRFNHAVATIAASQVIARLAVMKLLFILQGY